MNFLVILKPLCIGEKQSQKIRNRRYIGHLKILLSFQKHIMVLISIHAGNKSNGVDQEIKNTSEYKMAIKEILLLLLTSSRLVE